MNEPEYKKMPKSEQKINGPEIYPFLVVFLFTIGLLIKGFLE
tara:strand:+ start:1088 stop:1213 length:126 start_codon:yes stop_codon:yes gene_type:complete